MITYAATGITQANSTVTGATSNAASTYSTTTLQSTVSFAALGGVVAGMRIVTPDALAGAEVLTASATSITVYPGSPTAVASGIPYTFIDSDGVLTNNAATGLALTTSGTAPNAQRFVFLNGTGAQFTINGNYTIDAAHNRYICAGASNQIGFIINGTLNIVGTNRNTAAGTALFGGQIAITPSSQSALSETITTTIVQAGTLNITGAGYYGNSPWVLDTVGRAAGAAGSVTNLNNAFIRLGTAANGAINTIYADAFRGTSLTSRFTFNVTNSSLVDIYCKFLSVRTSSTFSGARWYKTIPQTTTAVTNLDVAIAIAPNAATDIVGFNFVAPVFGLAGTPTSYYNTHIGIGNTVSNNSAPTAVRSTVYGYEINVAPRIGKVADFPSCRPWVEGRKNLSLTIRNPNGTIVSTNAAGTYLEDSNLNTGQLAYAQLLYITQGSGYTNGTFASTIGVIGGGGTGGQVTVVVAGGVVVDAYVSTVGSGYSSVTAAGIPLTINSANFVGIGTPTVVGYLTIWPYQRYGASTAGLTPDFTGNRIYIADANASGVLNTTTTNSGTSGVVTSAGNPVPPNGAAYTGLDLLLWAANCSFPDYGSSFAFCQALIPIDQRFSANGATAYSVTIPIRGYLYADNTFTLTEAAGGGATDTATATLFLTSDSYIVSTGIAEATAATYSDVILATYVPTRDATTSVLIPTTTGTISAGSARTLDQVIAKTKYDYTRRALSTTAGFVARTGFGMSSFLTSSGVTGSANIDIGSWNTSFVGKITNGTVFSTLTTTGIVAIQGQATALADNGIGITAGVIRLGTAGTAATWTTNYTPTATASSGTLTLSGLGTLTTTGSVTTGTITTTTSAANNNIAIASALQAVLPRGANVIANTVAASNASFTLTLTANASTGNFSNVGTITFGAVLTAIGFPATMQVYSGLQVTTGTVACAHIASGFNFSGARPAGWTAYVTVSTASATGVVTFTGPGVWTGTPAPTFADTATTPGTRTITFGGLSNGVAATYSLGFTLPSVAGGVTPAPTYTTGGAIAVGSAFSNASIVASTVSTNGSTIFQRMTASNAITFLPTSGVIGNGSAINFGTSSAVTLTGDISFTACTISGLLALNVGATNFNLTLANCGTISTFPFSRVGTGTVYVLPTGNTNITAAIPTGFVANVQTVVTLNFSDAPTVAPTIRVAELSKNSGTGVTLSNPTFANGAYTWTVSSLTSDSIDGGIFLIDGYGIARGTSSINTVVTANATPELNVDFGQTLTAADTAFIATTAWNVVNAFAASNAYVQMLTSQATDYQTTPSTRTAVELAKLVWRRTFETSNANTILFRRALARGTLPVSWFSFSQSGVILNQIVGTATTGVGLQINKDSSRANVITYSIWAVDNLGNFYNLNNANARATTSATTLILWEGFSPGAVANLNTGQINQVASTVATNLVGTQGSPGALGKIADGVNKASLVIPAGINLYN